MKPERPFSRKFYAWMAAAEVIAHATGGRLIVQRKNLGPAEREELVALTVRAADGGGFNLRRLSSDEERHRWEELAERASGHEPRSFFAAAREEAAFRAELSKLAWLARRPLRRPLLEEEGSVRLPARIFSGLDRRTRPCMTVETLGLLCHILFQLENAQALGPYSRIEGAGDECRLVIPRGWGLGAKHTSMTDWPKRLDHLAGLQYLTVERRGRDLVVGRGPRLTQQRGRPAA